MCGIFAVLSKHEISTNDYVSANMIRNRGPDNTTFTGISKNVSFCFHRLKINDLSDDGNQPIQYNNVSLICNGEIYNSNQLKEEFDLEWKSNSDCEVLGPLYEKYGFKEMCNKIDGVFAIVLYDSNINKVFIGRDPFGVRPMFFGDNDETIQISSEMKGIDPSYRISQFPPGHYSEIQMNSIKCTEPKPYINLDIDTVDISYKDACIIIKNSFQDAVHKRLMSDRPIGCLLSGGLDSSLVSSIVAREFKQLGKGQLNTFSIGFKGSTDLEHARKVAEHIGSKHHEILLTEKEFLDSIVPVIKTIESYDTTTVRASVGNYLVSKYIKENTDITVVFNGDGSDEVAGGYLYMKKSPTNEDFHNECLRLLNEISYFDVLRSDRSLSSKWSLESRTPFLDKSFVKTYLSMPVEYRVQSSHGIEKSLLRNAFKNDNLLPDSVLWRQKEAFSDGVSGSENSWHNVIKKYIDSQITDEEYNSNHAFILHNTPELKESYYYRKVFEHYYPHKSKVIPHFWMPRWTDTKDPSARELK